MTANQILIGIGLILALPVGAQVRGRCPWLAKCLAIVENDQLILVKAVASWPGAMEAAIRKCRRPVINASP